MYLFKKRNLKFLFFSICLMFFAFYAYDTYTNYAGPVNSELKFIYQAGLFCALMSIITLLIGIFKKPLTLLNMAEIEDQKQVNDKPTFFNSYIVYPFIFLFSWKISKTKVAYIVQLGLILILLIVINFIFAGQFDQKINFVLLYFYITILIQRMNAFDIPFGKRFLMVKPIHHVSMLFTLLQDNPKGADFNFMQQDKLNDSGYIDFIEPIDPYEQTGWFGSTSTRDLDDFLLKSEFLATNPLKATLSLVKMRALNPKLFEPTPAEWEHATTHPFKYLAKQLYYGDSCPAVVVDLYPPIVAAYSDDFEDVVLLKLPPEIVQRYGYTIGSRLITCNLYAQINGSNKKLASDIINRSHSNVHFYDFNTLLADLVTDDISLLKNRKQEIDETLWIKVAELGREKLLQPPFELRSGIPFEI